jgi:hypothetical protein
LKARSGRERESIKRVLGSQNLFFSLHLLYVARFAFRAIKLNLERLSFQFYLYLTSVPLSQTLSECLESYLMPCARLHTCFHVLS